MSGRVGCQGPGQEYPWKPRRIKTKGRSILEQEASLSQHHQTSTGGRGWQLLAIDLAAWGVSGDYDVILVGDWNWTESTWVLPHQLPSPLLSLPPSAVLESPAVHIAHCFPKNQHLDLFMRCFHFNLFLSFLCLLWFCLFVFVLSNCLSLVNHLCFHVSGGLILRL